MAVAVRAIVGGEPSRARTSAEPQVVGPEVVAPLAQAVRLVDRQRDATPAASIASRNRRLENRSGATYSRRTSPPRTRASVSATASLLMLEAIISTPSRPRARSAAYWSFISAISGETTSVSCPSISAGNW